ncbi:MAG: glycoside hydrolase domain-containing protein [Candidatus Brocadiia bacterium]
MRTASKLLLVIICGCTFFLSSARAAKDSVATVSLFEEAPTLDGEIEPGEWDGAVRTTGFMALKGRWLERGMGATYCGFTRKRLYVALITELPPDQQLRARKKYRDSELIYEDSFEIWLDPFRKTEDGWKGGGTYFQTMGISNGTISDTKFSKEGAPDKGWNGNWEFANGIHTEVTDGPKWAQRNGVWVAELSIPFKDLGWEGDPVGRSIGVLVARNFKRARGWKQVTWFPHKGSFVSWFQYPEIKLTEDKPSVQIQKLGDNVLSGEIDLETRIFNPGPERRAKVALKISSSDMPSVEEKKVMTLPAGEAVTYKHSVPAERFHETAKHKLDLKVSSEDGSSQYLNYFANIKQRGPFWNVRTGPNPKKAVRLAYYPSYKFIKVRVDTRELAKDAAQAERADVQVKSPDGEMVFEGDFSWEGDIAEQRFDIGELSDGQYTVEIKVTGGDYERSFNRNFRREHYVWENNNLGVSATVFEPFEPIEVEGNEVSVVMRKYRKGGLGLWESVQAVGNDRRSQYRELLTGPISLHIGDETLDGEGRFTSTEDHKVVYKGRADHPAVQVHSRTVTEFDGCMRVELTLRPGKKDEELKNLYLDIPVKDELASLFHVTTTGLRRNPADVTPEGSGRIWDSRDFPDGEWYGNFNPYLWIGGPERGICWFADNDRGWVLDANPGDPSESVPSQELIRKGDTLTLRVNLVQKPITLEDKRTIVFGLMASPAKPMRKDWRKYGFNRQYEDYPWVRWMGSTYWGAAQTMKETYPLNADFSILDKTQEMRLTGSRVGKGDFLRTWERRNLSDYEARGRKSKKQILSLVNGTLERGRAAHNNGYMNVYWEEFHRVSRFHPETQVFGNEWSGGYGKGNMHSLTPSYLNFQCWYGAEFLRRGVGLYFDNTFPKRAYDPVTTSAYRLPNGDIQPSANMWRHREYLRRIWTLHKQLAPADTPPIMMLHMTNTHIVPYMVWNQSNLDLEWFYGPDPQQSKYPHALLRTESMGLQTGNLPLALAHIKDVESKEERQRAQRSRFGTLFVHEIKWRYKGAGAKMMRKVLDFGYGREDCAVYNYWDPDDPVMTSNSEVKSILLERDGQLLLVLTTWNGEPETVTVSLDSQNLDVDPETVVDAETEESIELDGDEFALEMEGYGVRMIRIR